MSRYFSVVKEKIMVHLVEEGISMLEILTTLPQSRNSLLQQHLIYTHGNDCFVLSELVKESLHYCSSQKINPTNSP
jgi:hypothetical protein